MVPRVTIADDYSISRIIKGGWQLAGGHGAVSPSDAHSDMNEFVQAGITTFDCADIYTGVEALIGEFLQSEAGRAVQVHTKCVPDLEQLHTLTPADIERTVERSAHRLGVSALDVVQLHWWDYALGDVVSAARTLHALRESGLIRHIGATNFDTPTLERILDAGVPVVSHQVQYSLLDRRPAGNMTALAKERGVALLCYGALAGGFFRERWLGAPEPVEPLENRSLTKYKLIIDESGGWAAFQALLAVLAQVASTHGVTIGAVAIRWVLEQSAVAAVIVGARNRAHLDRTLAAMSFELTAHDHERIGDLLDRHPVPPGDVYTLERDRNGPHGRIMRYNLNSQGRLT